MDTNKVLLIIRGAPGSGKSTIAKALVDSLLFDSYWEADMYFLKNGKYEYNKDKLHLAHKWCAERVEEDMNLGFDIIVSNTFCKDLFVRPYEDLAEQYHYMVQYMYLESSFKSIHGVPDEQVERMRHQLYDSMANIGRRNINKEQREPVYPWE